MGISDLPTLADQGRCAELWRPVVGFPDYEVSDRGGIRRHRPVSNSPAGRVLRCLPNSYGYPSVKLRRNGATVTCRVHSLVMAAFVGPRPAGYTVNHIDFNRANNELANLEYVTQLENNRHSIAAGRQRPPRNKAGDAATAKLTVEDVKEIRRRYAAGEWQRFIAKDFGIRADSIHKIASGRSWKKVPL